MSVVTILASSSWCSTTRARSAKRARARCWGGVARQAGKASRAAAAAAATSSVLDSGTSASTAPLAGERVSSVLAAFGSTQAPPT